MCILHIKYSSKIQVNCNITVHAPYCISMVYPADIGPLNITFKGVAHYYKLHWMLYVSNVWLASNFGIMWMDRCTSFVCMQYSMESTSFKTERPN